MDAAPREARPELQPPAEIEAEIEAQKSVVQEARPDSSDSQLLQEREHGSSLLESHPQATAEEELDLHPNTTPSKAEATLEQTKAPELGRPSSPTTNASSRPGTKDGGRSVSPSKSNPMYSRQKLQREHAQHVVDLAVLQGSSFVTTEASHDRIQRYLEEYLSYLQDIHSIESYELTNVEGGTQIVVAKPASETASVDTSQAGTSRIQDLEGQLEEMAEALRRRTAEADDAEKQRQDLELQMEGMRDELIEESMLNEAAADDARNEKHQLQQRLEQLVGEHEHLATLSAELQEENQRLEKENDVYNSIPGGLEGLQGEIAALKTQLETREAAKDASDQEMQGLRDELDIVKTRLSVAESSEATAVEASEQVKRLQDELNAARDATKVHSQEVASEHAERVHVLEAQIETLQADLTVASQEREAASADATQVAVLQDEIKSVKAELETRNSAQLANAASEKEVAALKDQLNSAEAARESLQQQMSDRMDTDNDVDALEARLAEMERQRNHVSEQNERLQHTIDWLGQKNDSSSVDLSFLREEFEVYKREAAQVPSLTSELESVREAAKRSDQKAFNETRLREDMQQQLEQRKQLESADKGAANQVHQLREQLAQESQRAATRYADMQSIKLNLDTTKAERDRQANELAGVKFQLENEKDNLRRYQARINEETESRTEVEAELVESRSRLAATERDLAETERTLKSAMESASREAQQQIQQLRREINGLEKNLSRTQEDLKHAISNANKQTTLRVELEAEKEDLIAKLEESQAAHTTTRSALEGGEKLQIQLRREKDQILERHHEEITSLHANYDVEKRSLHAQLAKSALEGEELVEAHGREKADRQAMESRGDEELAKQKRELAELNDQLRSDVTAKDATIASLRASLDEERQHGSEELAMQNTELIASNQELQAELTAKEAALAELRASTERQQAAEDEQLATQKEDLAGRAQTLQQELTTKDAMIAQLNQSLEQVRQQGDSASNHSARVSQLQNKLQLRSNTIDQLKGNVDAQKEQIESLETTIAEQQQQLDTYAHHIEGLEGAAREAQDDIAVRDTVVNELENKNSQMDERLKSRLAVIDSLKDEIASHQNEVDVLEGTIAELQQEVESNRPDQRRVRELEHEVESLQSRAAADTAAATPRDLARQPAPEAATGSATDDRRLKELEARNELLEQERIALHGELRSLREEVLMLEAENQREAEKIGEMEKAMAVIAELDNSMEHLRHRNSNLRKEVEPLTAEVSKLQKKTKDLESSNERLMQDRRSILKERDAFEEDSNRFERQVGDITAAIALSHSRVAESLRSQGIDGEDVPLSSPQHARNPSEDSYRLLTQLNRARAIVEAFGRFQPSAEQEISEMQRRALGEMPLASLQDEVLIGERPTPASVKGYVSEYLEARLDDFHDELSKVTQYMEIDHDRFLNEWTVAEGFSHLQVERLQRVSDNYMSLMDAMIGRIGEKRLAPATPRIEEAPPKTGLMASRWSMEDSPTAESTAPGSKPGHSRQKSSMAMQKERAEAAFWEETFEAQRVTDASVSDDPFGAAGAVMLTRRAVDAPPGQPPRSRTILDLPRMLVAALAWSGSRDGAVSARHRQAVEFDSESTERRRWALRRLDYCNTACAQRYPRRIHFHSKGREGWLRGGSEGGEEKVTVIIIH